MTSLSLLPGRTVAFIAQEEIHGAPLSQLACFYHSNYQAVDTIQGRIQKILSGCGRGGTRPQKYEMFSVVVFMVFILF